MTKHNFYLITGGPGGGKTSLLESLASKGYRYVPETARQIIKERVLQGLTARPDPKAFAQEIFDTDWANFTSNSGQSSLLFFDRSFMDSAWQLFSCDKAGYNKIKDILLKNRYNNKVFIVPPWKEIYTTDTERDQSFEESVEVYERLEGWYKEHDYDILILPKDSIEDRVKFVISHVTN
jgi:predicted ATPase